VPFATLVTSLTLVSTSDAQIHIPNFGDLPNGTVAGFDGNSLATLEAHGVYSLPATGSTPFVNSFLPNNWSALPTGAAAAGIIGSFAKRANGNLLHADSLFGGAVREYGPSGVWTPLGPPIAGGAVLAVAEIGGTVYAGGFFGPLSSLWSFDDVTSTWLPVPGIAGGGVIHTIRSSGDLALVGGQFVTTTAGPLTLATWDQTDWAAVPGVPPGMPIRITELPSGDLVTLHHTAGAAPAPYSLWRRSGSAWSRLARNIDQPVNVVVELPDNDLVIGGSFTTLDGVPMGNVARFDDRSSTWSSFANVQGRVLAVRWLNDGWFVIGGQFSNVTTAAGTVPADNVAMFLPSSGLVVGIAPGCAGVGGSSTLVHTTFPHIGTTFTAQATSGGNSPLFAFQVLGLTPVNLLLSSLLPNSAASCFLTASPDLVQLLSPSGTATETSVVIPNQTALVGLSLLQQVVFWDAVASTLTNTLQVTIGRL